MLAEAVLLRALLSFEVFVLFFGMILWLQSDSNYSIRALLLPVICPAPVSLRKRENFCQLLCICTFRCLIALCIYGLSLDWFPQSGCTLKSLVPYSLDSLHSNSFPHCSRYFPHVQAPKIVCIISLM